MTNKGTIVILSNTHWHSAWQTGNSVAAGFASRGYNVLFVEPIPKRWPRISEYSRVLGRVRGDSQKAGVAKQRIPAGVTLIGYLALPDVGGIAKLVNRTLFMRRLVANIRRHLSAEGPLILMHTLPIEAAIVFQKHLDPDLSVYRCVYDWSADPHSGRQLAEAELLEQVDIAWADCEHNLERIREKRLDARLMPSAVDLHIFSEVKYEAAGAEPPLCVYFGSIGLALDFELLQEVSHHYSLRLIGPVLQTLDGLSEETDIVGPVPHEKIPGLIRDADVLLLPYANKPHMRGVIPAKFFECLITGKPIVASNLHTVSAYKEIIYLCRDRKEVFEAIEQSRDESPLLAQQRIQCAKENSWDTRLDEMEAHLLKGLAQRGTLAS